MGKGNKGQSMNAPPTTGPIEDLPLSQVAESAQPDLVVSVTQVETTITATEQAETVFELEKLAIEIPFGVLPPGFLSRRVDVQQMTLMQTENLHRILWGLKQEDAKLENGKRVDCLQDAIKWWLEAYGKTVSL